MKISIAKQDLERSLSVVAHAMSTTGSDLSSHFLFRLQPDAAGTLRAEVLTNSGRIYAGCPLIAEVEGTEGEAFTIEGSVLKLWLNGVPDAVLVFTLDASTVACASPHGIQRFDSLDPDNFHYWDKTLKDAQETGVVSASRFRDAVDFSRQFASDKDTQDRKISVCEMSNGSLLSTNRTAASIVNMTGLDKVGVRIHIKDAPSLMAFLVAAGEGDIRILEAPRQALFQRGDGALFGMTRFEESFKLFSRPGDDERIWTLSLAELRGAIPYLRSGAAKEDIRLVFSRPDPTGPVVLSMQNKSDGKPAERKIACQETVSPKATPLPASFAVGYPHLEKALDVMRGDTVQIGVNVRVSAQGAKGGYLRYYEKRGTDDYWAIIVWLRDL